MGATDLLQEGHACTLRKGLAMRHFDYVAASQGGKVLLTSGLEKIPQFFRREDARYSRVFSRGRPQPVASVAREYPLGVGAVNDLRDSGADLILVDVHAGAKSEKQAMGYHLEGRLQALVGTHTHVPTADARILPGGTAYVTDVGMTGAEESVIGFDRQAFLGLFLGKKLARLEASRGTAVLNAVLIEVDIESHRATSIERVYEDAGLQTGTLATGKDQEVQHNLDLEDL